MLPVVPHAGDVDRNTLWPLRAFGASVVPHAGDVDRNFSVVFGEPVCRKSSPTRGTWIEIELCIPKGDAHDVVPHAGDVDRNQNWASTAVRSSRRPPRGGRG